MSEEHSIENDQTMACTKCGKVQAVSLFRIIKRKGCKPKRRRWCNQCHIDYNKAWTAKKKLEPGYYQQHRFANQRYEYLYGLTKKEYERVFDFQNGVCAICGQPETALWKGSRKRLAVDHNHATGEIRGLLCSNCNIAIGKLKEDVALFAKAIEYLTLRSKIPIIAIPVERLRLTIARNGKYRTRKKKT